VRPLLLVSRTNELVCLVAALRKVVSFQTTHHACMHLSLLWVDQPTHRQDIGEQRAYEKACQALREGAPNLRAKVAAKEVAAAALCLDNLGRYRSAGSSGSHTTLPGCSPVRSCAVDEERDDRSPPVGFKDLSDKREE